MASTNNVHIPEAMDTSADFVLPTTENIIEVTVGEVPLSDSDNSPNMIMVHSRDLKFDTDHGKHFYHESQHVVHPDCDIYQLGGKVCKICINGQLQDVIVCNRNICPCVRLGDRYDYNTLGSISVSMDDYADAQSTNGLPIVHFYDLDFSSQQRRFKGSRHPVWQDVWGGMDTKWQKEKVVFTKGAVELSFDATVCVPEECRQCKAKLRVEKAGQ